MSSNAPGSDRPRRRLDDQAMARLIGDNYLTRRQRIDWQTSELFFSSFDILVHAPGSHKELEEMELAAAYNKLKTEMTGLKGGEAFGEGWTWSQGQSVFERIFNGYDASYYSCVLVKVYALNMWERGGFSAARTLSELKEAGKRLRDEVCAVSGSQPEMMTLTRYLGGPPSADPYLRWLRV
ncbi:hypothetical protein B0T16DRAFT_493823 [Cercophora newfieldiana]|uniref:Peptidase M3A/M3B catalytic domain-containing protein n=1 Tax=Cercophora newfieldiana TaxID=92897 RepID=A0AA40CQ32_9PEZI|nr:hypothetical protein B0T16DRAFT_493823 [Cercophora newfieldiana]